MHPQNRSARYFLAGAAGLLFLVGCCRGALALGERTAAELAKVPEALAGWLTFERPVSSPAPVTPRTPLPARAVALDAGSAREPRDAPHAPDPLTAPPCAGVTASIVTESRDARWSTAVLHDARDPVARTRRQGERLVDRQVAFIGFNPHERSPAVWLTRADGEELCQVLLFHLPADVPVAPPPSNGEPAASSIAATSTFVRELVPKIRALSETEFEIDGSVVDTVLENQTELMRAGRVVPDGSGGVPTLRLAGIRPGSLLTYLGLRDGDRIEAINGFGVANPEQALMAYARVRSAPTVKLVIRRGGAPLALEYRMR